MGQNLLQFCHGWAGADTCSLMRRDRTTPGRLAIFSEGRPRDNQGCGIKMGLIDWTEPG